MKSPSAKPSSLQVITGLIKNSIQTKRGKIAIIGLLAIFALLGLFTILMAIYLFKPQWIPSFTMQTPPPNSATLTQMPSLNSSTPSHTPRPTPLCVSPSLFLGETSYPLSAIVRPADGSLPSFSGQAGIAWWISDTYSPFIFMLKLEAGSPDLKTALQTGDPMVVQWADCGREESVLANIQDGSPDAQALLAETTPGIAVIVQTEDGAQSYVLRGERSVPAELEMPEPTDPNAIQADISFGDTAVSADQQTLQTSLILTNRSANPIIMTTDDLSLTAEGKTSLSPLSVQPVLPQEIPPEGSLSLTITFPNPGGNTAVLQVLDVTVDLYY